MNYGLQTEIVQEARNGYLDHSLLGYIKYLSKILQDIPEDCRDSARISLENYYYDYDPNTYKGVEIYYQRPWTKEEIQEHQANQKASADEIQAREKAEFERLKTKFGK